MRVISKKLDDNGEPFYFDTEKLVSKGSVIVIRSEKIEKFTDSKSSYIVDFGFELEKDGDDEKVYLTAKCDELNAFAKEELDCQAVLDAIIGCYEATEDRNKFLDKTEFMQTIKKVLLTKCSDNIIQAGNIAVNCKYEVFGFIKSEDNPVATFEAINVISQTNVELDKIVNFDDIEKLNETTINFWINGMLFEIPINIKKVESGLTFEATGISAKKVDKPEEYNVTPKEDFVFTEDLEENRRAILTGYLEEDDDVVVID